MEDDEWEWDGTRSNLVNQFNLTCGNTYKVHWRHDDTLSFNLLPLRNIKVGVQVDFPITKMFKIYLGVKYFITLLCATCNCNIDLDVNCRHIFYHYYDHSLLIKKGLFASWRFTTYETNWELFYFQIHKSIKTEESYSPRSFS